MTGVGRVVDYGVQSDSQQPMRLTRHEEIKKRKCKRKPKLMHQIKKLTFDF